MRESSNRRQQTVVYQPVDRAAVHARIAEHGASPRPAHSSMHDGESVKTLHQAGHSSGVQQTHQLSKLPVHVSRVVAVYLVAVYLLYVNIYYTYVDLK